MRLGSAGDWRLASGMLNRGIEEAQNTLRGGTIQEVQTRNVKQFMYDVLGMMSEGKQPTAQELMATAEDRGVDPVMAAQALSGIMQFMGQAKKRKEKSAYMKSVPPKQMERYNKKRFLGIDTKEPEPFTLSRGARRYRPDGTLMAENEDKIWITGDNRKLEIPKSKWPEWEKKGFKKGVPVKQRSPEMTRAKAEKELARIAILKDKVQTMGGLDPMTFAMISQTMPDLASAIKTRDHAEAIEVIDRYGEYLKTFIPEADREKYVTKPVVTPDSALKKWQRKGAQAMQGINQ